MKRLSVEILWNYYRDLLFFSNFALNGGLNGSDVLA